MTDASVAESCGVRLRRLLDARRGAPSLSPAVSPCQSCGACCGYSQNWPRFTMEAEAALDRIPSKFINDRQSGMRCDGDRCTALSGKIGEATACAIYADRPEVCRACEPGDIECGMARQRFGLPALAA